MSAKFSGLNPKGTYLGLEKEKENVCVVLTHLIKRASEIRKVFVAVVQQRLRNVQKKRDARARAVAKTPYCCDPEILLPW